MEDSEFVQAQIIPPDDLADRLKLTTERCFYANDFLFMFLSQRIDIPTLQGSSIINDNNYTLRIILERYSQK